MAFGKVLPQEKAKLLDRLLERRQQQPKYPIVQVRKSTHDLINELCQREADLIEEVFNERGLEGCYIDTPTYSPIAGYIRYPVEKPVGVSVTKITALQNDIAQVLTRGRPDDDDVKVNIRLPSLIIEVEYPHERKPLDWELAPLRKLTPGESIIGRDYSGIKAKPVTVDLCGNEFSNILIGALPGSGKSQAVVQMVASACYAASPEELRVFILDLKCSKEMKLLGQLRHASFHSEPDECVAIIAAIREEIERRKNNTDRRSIIIVIDELAEFCSNSKEHAELLPVMRSIARMGRSFGVKMIVATQYPTAEATDSEFRAMCNERMGGHVGTKIQSGICMGVNDVGCETLPMRGAFYYRDGNSKIRRINTHYLPYEGMFDVVDEINDRWLERHGFLYPGAKREEVVAEVPEKVGQVSDSQLAMVLDEWTLDQLIKADTRKLRYGMGAKTLRLVFGPDVDINSGTSKRWKKSLVQRLGE